jgi:GNAT superfamily N-acetyltransferase
VLNLLSAALAGGPTGSRSSEFLRWKHVDNPFGSSPGLLAVDQGRVVGLRLFLRWEFRSAGRIIRAVRPVDTATHPDYQGRGIFRTLTQALADSLIGDADLIFNTPNDQSLPGYLKMGWQAVGVIPIHIHPVHKLRFVRHFPTARQGQPPGTPTIPFGARTIRDVLSEPSLSSLLEEAEPDAAESRLHTRRDLAFLRWRFADVPGLIYHAVTVESQSHLTGIAIGRIRRRGQLCEFTLADVICRQNDHSTVRQLLRGVARLDVDHVAMHAAARSTTSSIRKSAGYVKVPQRGMRLVARPLSTLSPDPTVMDSWRFTLGDLEVF